MSATRNIPPIMTHDPWHLLRRRDSEGVWRYTVLGHLHKVIHIEGKGAKGCSGSSTDVRVCVSRALDTSAVDIFALVDQIDKHSYRERPKALRSALLLRARRLRWNKTRRERRRAARDVS